jgi:hypothetical protein
MKCFYFLLISLIFLVGCISEPPPLVLVDEASQRIGGLGPVRFKINSPFQSDQTINRVKIKPDTDLILSVKKDILEIKPRTFFLPDFQYEITLINDKSENITDKKETEFSWRFKTQPICLLFIASVTKTPEIWKSCLENQLAVQLSHTNGRVADYDPSVDGRWIVYSVTNEKGGADIWMMDRDGKNNRIIYSCGTDVCTNLQFIADDEFIAFVKLTKYSENENSGFEISLINKSQLTITRLLVNEKVNPILLGSNSIDSKLTFFDTISTSIWIVDIETKAVTKLPAGEGLGGSWNRMDGTFTFSRMVYWGGIPFGELVNFDPVAGKERILIGSEKEPNEYFNPQWRPQHDYLAVAYRPIEGSSSKQIILISKDGEQKIEVSKDQTYSYGKFAWSIDGQLIAYQRIQLGNSNATPEIGLWTFENQSNLILETGAAVPKWLP